MTGPGDGGGAGDRQGDHWGGHASQWANIGPPLRPQAHDIRLLEGLTAQWAQPAGDRPQAALLLGVTAEIAAMRWPAGTLLFAVDRNVAMIRELWAGSALAVPALATIGDWRSLPFADGVLRFVLGDGCHAMMPAAADYDRLSAEVTRVLAPDGVFLARLFVRPALSETTDEVFAALDEGAIGSFHAFNGGWPFSPSELIPESNSTRVVLAPFEIVTRQENPCSARRISPAAASAIGARLAGPVSTSRASVTLSTSVVTVIASTGLSAMGSIALHDVKTPVTRERALPTPAVAADAAAVTEVVVALESSLYGQSAFSQADLEDEWSELDLERDARVVRDGDRIVGYGVVRGRGELWRVEGYVHPDALGRGIGTLIATGLEEDAARRGARRIQNAVLEADSAARWLLESLGYGAMRVFRELRVELEAPPPAPEWPDGLRVVPFDPGA